MADAIEGVATAFPAFIGYSEKAAAFGEPAWVASLAQYRAAFGGAGPAGFRLDTAMRAFYANGGDDALVLSVGPYDADAAPDPAPLLAGLERIGRETGPSLLLIPDALRLERGDYHDVVRAMLAQCAALGDRMAILDLHGGGDPATWSVAGSAPLIGDFRAAVAGQPGLRAAVAYHPWLVGPDRAVTPPSAAMAGLFARIDREQGIMTAPTNIAPVGAAEATFNYREFEIADLVRPESGLSINPIRTLHGIGLRVWGARTLDGNSNDYRYIPVARTLIWLRQSLTLGLAPLVPEPNTVQTWLAARRLAEDFLTLVWRSGLLQGDRPDHAFYVACGLGITMTQDDIDNGRLIVEIGMAPVRPAEFIVIRIAQLQQG